MELRNPFTVESLTKLSERDQHFDIGVLVLEVLVDHLEPMLNAVLGYGDLLNFFSKLLQDATQIETTQQK